MPSGPRIRANNVYGIIGDNPLTAGSTTYNSVSLPLLPVVASAHAVVVLDPKRVYGDPEIVVVTVHTAGSTVATILRGQYGTSPREHPAGTVWSHVPIDEDFVEITTSVGRPSNPYAGQKIFEIDTDKYVARNAANTAWVDAVPLGAWRSWTPAVTQVVAVTSTVVYAAYTKIGRIVYARCRLNITSGGTTANTVFVSLPVPGIATTASVAAGVGWVYDLSATTMYNGTWNTENAGLLASLVVDGATGGAAWGSNPNAPISNGDILSFSLTYEAVS